MIDTTGESGPEEVMENPPADASAESYIDLELEVARNFAGDWSHFLRALQNPAEVLAFVRRVACNEDDEAFADWMKEKELPPAWLGRFQIALAEMAEKANAEAAVVASDASADPSSKKD